MKLLFQGDSVTDCGRDRSRADSLGGGYVSMISDVISSSGETLLNRGVAGDTVKHLDSRWEDDCVALQPDIVTILIGINDVWRQFDSGQPLDLGNFELTYQRLIDRIPPTAKRVILMEPFLIPSTPDKAPMRPLLDATIRVIRNMAHGNRLTFVPLDSLFASACAENPPSHWAPDGVHPSPAGHRLIADAWVQAYQVDPLVS